MEAHLIRPIAHIYNDYTEKFGIPRQSGLVNTLESVIVFEKEYQNPDCLRGLEDYSHLWLLWGFSKNPTDSWSPTVRPPRLGGNIRAGVFATRSPFRPNGIGLSSVAIKNILLDSTSGPIITVLGADLMNETPIYDIKPYVAFSDSHPEAKGGFSDHVKDYKLNVICSPDLLSSLPEEKQQALIEILSQDPRPSYHTDPERVYGLAFGKFNVKFQVRENTLSVINISLSQCSVS